jgi:carbamoyltransferase
MTPAEHSEVVLGYSGLDGSAEFKHGTFPGLDAREARLFQGLDSAAALVVDGELVAAVQQERYSGIKFDHAFPVDAINSCLRSADVTIEEVGRVAHNFDYTRTGLLSQGDPITARRYSEIYHPTRQTELLHKHFPSLTERVLVEPVRHHLAHALTAAIPSGFDRALVVVIDGMGELHAISVYQWSEGRLRRLTQLDYRSSLGLFYATATMHLGFWPNSDEYKVMALAATGDPARFSAQVSEAVTLGPDGSVQIPLLGENRTLRARETLSGSRDWLTVNGCSERTEGPIDQVHLDLAAAVQQRVETAIFHIVSHWVRRTGIDQVALAGGVALNCVAVGKLAQSGLVSELYVQPAAGDEGTAIGAALSKVDPTTASTCYPQMTFLGPHVTELMPPRNHPFWHRTIRTGQAERVTAMLLARGVIAGWAQGRLEFGPRALGHRSIFADPRQKKTREKVNTMVKFREEFRPLAPMVAAERAEEYFVLPPAELRHMTIATRVRPGKASLIPAVVHDDGTARIQVVHQTDLPRVWQILDHFARLTGVPVLMNTSLNVKGQPTARDGSEAFRTFESSDLEVIVIDDTIYAKDAVVRIVEDIMNDVNNRLDLTCVP